MHMGPHMCTHRDINNCTYARRHRYTCRYVANHTDMGTHEH